MTINDAVLVTGTTITGIIIEDYGNYVVILDDDSEYDYPDNRLEFRKSDLEVAE